MKCRLLDLPSGLRPAKPTGYRRGCARWDIGPPGPQGRSSGTSTLRSAIFGGSAKSESSERSAPEQKSLNSFVGRLANLVTQVCRPLAAFEHRHSAHEGRTELLIIFGFVTRKVGVSVRHRVPQANDKLLVKRSHKGTVWVRQLRKPHRWICVRERMAGTTSPKGPSFPVSPRPS